MKNQPIQDTIEYVVVDADTHHDFLVYDEKEKKEVALQATHSEGNQFFLFWSDGSKTTVTFETEEDDREGEWVEVEDELIFLTD